MAIWLKLVFKPSYKLLLMKTQKSSDTKRIIEPALVKSNKLVHSLQYFFFYFVIKKHSHTDTCLFLWIGGTFHRLLILYWPNDISYPLTLNLPLTENLFALLHFQINNLL